MPCFARASSIWCQGEGGTQYPSLLHGCWWWTSGPVHATVRCSVRTSRRIAARAVRLPIVSRRLCAMWAGLGGSVACATCGFRPCRVTPLCRCTCDVRNGVLCAGMPALVADRAATRVPQSCSLCAVLVPRWGGSSTAPRCARTGSTGAVRRPLCRHPALVRLRGGIAHLREALVRGHF